MLEDSRLHHEQNPAELSAQSDSFSAESHARAQSKQSSQSVIFKPKVDSYTALNQERHDADDAHLPKVELVSNDTAAKQTGDQIQTIKILLSPEKKSIAKFYQSERLIPFVAEKVANNEAAGADSAERQSDALAKLKFETESGVWGAASKLAMADYLAAQQKLFPNILTQLKSMGIIAPRGNPLPLPVENGRSISRETYYKRIASGELKLDFGIDPGEPPGSRDAQRLENAIEWINRAARRIQKHVEEMQDQDISDMIVTRGLPSGWKFSEEQSREAWRSHATEMINLTFSAGRALSVSDKLGLGLEGPPGTKITRNASGELNIDLRLPQSLQLSDPTDIEKVERLKSFVETSRPVIASALSQLESTVSNPVNAIAYADVEVPKSKNPKTGKEESAYAVMDANGNLASIAESSKLNLKPGETALPFNLLEQRPTVTVTTAGDIKVQMSVQAHQVPWYGYQNMLFVDPVGKPAQLADRIFKLQDLVAVQNGARVDFMRAEDLSAYFLRKAAFHYGEKVLISAMDAAMLATGTVEIAAALKGARALAAVGGAASSLMQTEAASFGAKNIVATGADMGANSTVSLTRLQLTRLQVAALGAKGALDFTLGASGLGANANVNSTETGRNVNAARGAVFVAAALPSGVEALKDVGRPLLTRFQASRGVDPKKLVNDQQRATAFESLIGSTGTAGLATARWSTKIMGYSQIPMAPIVGVGLARQVNELANPSDPYVLQRAIVESKSFESLVEQSLSRKK